MDEGFSLACPELVERVRFSIVAHAQSLGNDGKSRTSAAKAVKRAGI
jgi:hypothetical protein